MINSLWYSIKQAFVQVFRNRGMTIASFFSITAMLLILGLFFVMMVNVGVAMETAKMDYDTISAYLEEDIESSNVQVMMFQLEGMSEVKEVYYLDKDTAMKIWKEQYWGDNAYLLDSLPENPLPNSIEITVTELTDADAVVNVLKTFEGIEDIKYYKDTVEKLVKVTDSIQLAMIIVMGFLIFVSIVVVANTVKLTVFARQKEIEIMKYVGATNWFIRGPFIVEGIMIGLIAAGISVAIITFVYMKLVENIGTDVSMIIGSPMVPVTFLIANLAWVFLAIGVAIGAVGSIISIRRFLDT